MSPRSRPPAKSGLQRRREQREVRSYEASHVHALWHLDFHLAKIRLLEESGKWHRPVALAILDDHSRLCCHLQFYLAETAECLVHGLTQAIHEARPAAGPDDRQRRGHARRGNQTRACAPGRRAPDHLALLTRIKTASRKSSGRSSKAG